MNLETSRSFYEHDVIRERLLITCRKASTRELKERWWSYKFEDLMRTRIALGYYRHGDCKYPKDSEFLIEYIENKLKLYISTSNTELLVDIANLSLLEFKYGNKQGKHFKSIDRE